MLTLLTTEILRFIESSPYGLYILHSIFSIEGVIVYMMETGKVFLKLLRKIKFRKLYSQKTRERHIGWRA